MMGAEARAKDSKIFRCHLIFATHASALEWTFWTSLHSLDPLMHQFHCRLIHNAGADVRHSSQTEHVHAVVDDRLLGMAWNDQLSVLDAEGAMGGLDIDDAHVLQGERRQELELRVAATPLHVAMSTVGM